MTQSNPTPRPYVLVVAIDYSDIGPQVLAEAVRLAAAHERSQIHVVHALPAQLPAHGIGITTVASEPNPAAAQRFAPGFETQMARDMQAYVEKNLTEASTPGGSLTLPSTTSWTMHFRASDPTTAIVQLASDLEADVVVVGTHGRGWLARFLLGSVAEAVVRRAPCPVLIVRPVGATAHTDAPAIEPPCPQCVEARRASDGREVWCERHREHHGRAHTYHFTPFKSSHQSGLLIHPLI